MGLISTDKQLPKSMAKICILDILSDASRDHPLEQSDILARLVRKYGIGINRKTLHSHLSELVEAIDAIHYEEVDRTINGEVSPMMTNFWMEEEALFDDTEIAALIYSVLFSKHIYVKDKDSLIKRLESLSEFKLHHDMKNYLIDGMRRRDESNQLFWNLEVLNEAIQCKKLISFQLSTFDAEGKRITPKDRYDAIPLGIAYGNGDFHLIAYDLGTEFADMNLERIKGMVLGHGEKARDAKASGKYHLSSYRLDRMKDIRAFDDKFDWEEDFLEDGEDFGPEIIPPNIDFDMMEYFQKNSALFEGYEIQAVLAVSKNDSDIVPKLFDHFGASNVKRYKTEKDLSEAWASHLGERTAFKITANVNMLLEFALINCKSVEIVRPSTLKTRFRKLVQEAFLRELDLAFEQVSRSRYGSVEEAEKAIEPLMSRFEEAYADLMSAMLP